LGGSGRKAFGWQEGEQGRLWLFWSLWFLTSKEKGGGVWAGEGDDQSVVGGGCMVYEGEWLRVFF
jgi:hypothetical protein